MTSRWGDSTDASKCACGIFAAVGATENEAAMNQQEISKIIIAISPSLRSLLLFPSNNTSWFSTTTTETPTAPPAPPEEKTKQNRKLYDPGHEEDLKFL
jgi:hypothetical protein